MTTTISTPKFYIGFKEKREKKQQQQHDTNIFWGHSERELYKYFTNNSNQKTLSAQRL